MATNKAEILGLDTQPKETSVRSEDPKQLLDEILENSLQALKVEQMLSSEAAKMAIGVYSDEVIYNIPRRSSIGKEDWGILCDKIPGGCPNRRNKEKHVHTIGVGINGAIKIMNTYGGMDIEPSEPEIKEITLLENGKLITKAYWTTKVVGINKKTDTKLSLPFMQPTMKKTGDYYQFDEFGMQICVSKGLRNLILKLIPENIQQKWIKEYMEASTSATEKLEDKPKADATKENKPTGDVPNGDSELTVDSAIEHINGIGSITHLSNWYNKNATWVNKLKSEDKKKVVEVFNAKKDALSIPPANAPAGNGKTDVPELATTAQYEAIRELAQELGYDPDQLDAISQSLVGTNDIPGMRVEQANMILIELQKTKENRQSQVE
jgi:hypothetical protein